MIYLAKHLLNIYFNAHGLGGTIKFGKRSFFLPKVVVSVMVHTDASAENKLPLNAHISMGNLYRLF